MVALAMAAAILGGQDGPPTDGWDEFWRSPDGTVARAADAIVTARMYWVFIDEPHQSDVMLVQLSCGSDHSYRELWTTRVESEYPTPPRPRVVRDAPWQVAERESMMWSMIQSTCNF